MRVTAGLAESNGSLRQVYDSRTSRLTAKYRDQLRNPTLGNRVYATFTFFSLLHSAIRSLTLLIVCVLSVGTSALTGADVSSSGGGESSVGGGFTSVTVALSVCLSVTVSVLVVVGVVRRLRASTSTHHSAAAAATPGGVPAPHTRGSLPSWGFDSIRSKFSATSEAADDDQLSY